MTSAPIAGEAAEFTVTRVVDIEAATCFATALALLVDDRDRPGPPRRGTLDFHREARHREPGRR